MRAHCLIDGNRRLGRAALLVLLGVNGRRSTWHTDQAHDFIIAIADGQFEEVGELARQILDAVEQR